VGELAQQVPPHPATAPPGQHVGAVHHQPALRLALGQPVRLRANVAQQQPDRLPRVILLALTHLGVRRHRHSVSDLQSMHWSSGHAPPANAGRPRDQGPWAGDIGLRPPFAPIASAPPARVAAAGADRACRGICGELWGGGTSRTRRGTVCAAAPGGPGTTPPPATRPAPRRPSPGTPHRPGRPRLAAGRRTPGSRGFGRHRAGRRCHQLGGRRARPAPDRHVPVDRAGPRGRRGTPAPARPPPAPPWGTGCPGTDAAGLGPRPIARASWRPAGSRRPGAAAGAGRLPARRRREADNDRQIRAEGLWRVRRGA